MNFRLLTLRFLVPLLLLLSTASCRTCPMASCHTRKVHFHNGNKYRGQPLWKKQNPAVGEKIKTHNPKSGTHKADRSKPKE
ncbi:hypothetical protein [Hymenobacter cellulosilyticus]|uniref:Secreted protein n=1 Tax=Hymenobacter cellulosilyticus TaxID=2932248 RepID=A0A8T9Q774_9BACT|nr:hypothetical protein [Hymenobacter cellulosilyticus]UOQ70883.1 hypothetical protein MUN79_19670 [Hymenobacter cellulosilyticus]